ncbi:Conserved oligomeric Golgi complex subunit 7 [Kalmanozyma brasiliensis GHG001]|uniref:Conserved oligomeric Golgi complex subunit 7 n=1 Tax=Kalmanozyma brasiliensis (strain GHG001) TaxID=1365824 RepID=V5GQQ0_KALBG|nr:Conserved oligomeric Golgi complex subunit 7 [Kalmanozyma brasiliensis GHG001]EST08277.1 Conserved oligomeric Golgi complex subunit 7 [Kalmanozyma brasiliensis GHG001]
MLSRPAAERYGTSDHLALAKSDAIEALRKTNGPTQLAAWLDHYATLPAATGASVASTTQLEKTAAGLRELSLSLSSVRDASRTELDQIISSLVSTIPKLGIELRLMSETANTLQSRVQTLQAQSATKDADVDVTLAKIVTLYKAKAGLIEARHALREAQAWSTLESQVTVLVNEQRWQEAVDRIAKATDSLRLFSGSAKSNQERSELLHTLTQRIQEQLTPILRDAVTARNAEQVARMAKLLTQTQNGVPTFFQVYTRTRSQALLTRWSQTATETSDRPLPAQLTSLLGDLLALLGEERVASTSLFTDPNKAVQLLTADILVRLDPPIHACIQHATRAPDLEIFLAALTDAYKATEEAARAINAILPDAKNSDDKQQNDDTEAASAPVDSNLLALETSDKPWLRLLIEPFLPYQTRLATFEADAMQSRLHLLHAAAPAANVSTASTQALTVAKTSLRRSTALTKAFATPSLLSSLDSLFQTAMDGARVELSSELQSVLTSLQGRIRRMHASDIARQAALTYDERGEVLTSSDWDEFRKATERLSSCREAVAAIRGLEDTIAYQISELGVLAKAPASAEPYQSAVDFASPTTALATSTLNSTVLHELIARSKRFLSTAAWKSSQAEDALLPTAHASVLSIASTVQAFQHDLVLSQFLPELELYPSLPIWTSNKHPSIVNEYDLAMPKFSLSPTEAMARIGEAMLNLPRLFEGYADEALLFCLPTNKVDTSRATTPGADRGESTQTHTQQSTMVPSAEITAAERSTMHRQAFSTTTIPRSESSTSNATPEDGDDNAGVLSQYLRSLLTLFFSRFLTSVLPSLPRLTEIGAAQLAADLDYLSNISSVIYSESEAILRFWKKAAEIGADTGRSVVAQHVVGVKGDRSAPQGEGDLEGWEEGEVARLARSDAFRTVARLRGWL